MSDIIIPLKKLDKRLKDITSEEIINILNNMYFIREPKKSSYEIGRKGEMIIEEIIEGFMIEKRGSHCGDFVIYKKDYPNIEIMIEVKNYTSSVPSEQYEKFLNNIKDNKYAGGIFISNQPISGFNGKLITSDKIVIYSYDPNVINISCETLWCRLFDRFNYKMLDVEGEIQSYCKLLSSNLDTLVRTKNLALSIQKNNEKLINTLTHEIDSLISKQKKTINLIINKISPITSIIETSYFVKLPEGEYIYNSVPEIREYIEKIMNNISTHKNVIIAQNKNKFEVNYGEKKILLELFKTKVDIIFKPNKFDFNGIEDFSFASGHIIFTINKSNCGSERLFKDIMEIW